MKQLHIIIIVLFWHVSTHAQSYIINTIAGNGPVDSSTGWGIYSGDGSLAISTGIGGPTAIAVDKKGNVYFNDALLYIRKIDTLGIITTFAGTGYPDIARSGRPATATGILVSYIATDEIGNVYFTDGTTSIIRKIDTFGIVHIIAGIDSTTGAGGYNGDGIPATAARIHYPSSIIVDKYGNVFFEDEANHRIRKIDTFGIITTIAGNGSDTCGNIIDGEPATNAPICDGMDGIAVDSLGNVYFGSVNVFKINQSDGTIHNIAGIPWVIGAPFPTGSDVGPATATVIDCCSGLTIDNRNNIYYTCGNIYQLNTCGYINCVAGIDTSLLGGFSGDGGIATDAQLNRPEGITVDKNGNIYFCDTWNNRIRKLTPIINIMPIVSNDTVLCVGTEGTLYDSSSGGVWSASNNNVSVSTSGVITGLSAGIDTIFYSINCGFQSVYKIITINSVPVADTILGTKSICATTTTTLTNSVPGGTWSVSAGASISAGVLTAINSGIDTALYTVNNSCGTAVATALVTVHPLPVAGTITLGATFSSPSICVGATDTLTDSTIGGYWSSYDTHASVDAGRVTGLSAGADSIFYIVSNSCGTAKAAVAITVLPLPGAGTILSSADSICVGATMIVADSIIGGTWSLYNGNAILLGTTVTGVYAGVDSVIYTVTTTCGVTHALKAIQIKPLPHTAPIAGADTVCIAATITLTDSTAGGVWVAAGGSGALLTANMVTGIEESIYPVWYIYTNSCGADTAVKAIFVKSLPYAPPITATTDLCLGALDAVTNAVSGGTWLLTNSCATLSGDVLTGVTAGTDTVLYIITNSCGADTAMHSVTIINPPNCSSIAGADSLCVGSTTTVTDSSAGGMVSWWASNAHVTLSSTGVVTALSSGLDTVIFTITNLCGADTAYHPIMVKNIPAPPNITGINYACVGRAADTLTANPSSGNWLLTNSNALINGNILTAQSPGIDTIIYSITNECGSNYDSLVITIPDAWYCDSINEVPAITASNKEINIFPNPTSGFVTVSVLTSKATINISLVDMYGKTVAAKSHTAAVSSFDLRHLPAGNYMFIVDADGVLYRERLVVGGY
jgi:Secretion system C-terminal sorting domain/NHL repeat